MTRLLRGVFLALLLVALVVLGGLRIALPTAAGDVDATAGMLGPADAAELQAARVALSAGDATGAASHARAVLAREPLSGPAFALLAQALGGQGSQADVLARYRIAARRAPRDVHVRSWMAAHELQAGDYAAALAHIDALLSVSPPSRATLLPMLADLARSPAFADALAAHLAARPRWRGAVLQAVAAGAGSGGDRLFGALRRDGQLSAKEETRWIDGMLRANRWGDAYAHWAGGLSATARLPLVYNGGFDQLPTSRGFDWHVARTRGVVFQTGGDAGAGGARITFLGRPVGDAGLAHPLLLAPGRHVLSMRARAPDLRAEAGLEWTITCAPTAAIPVRGARITARRQWQDVRMAFEIPVAGCEGQWLRLVNAAPPGMAQVLRGELELDDIVVQPGPPVGNATP